VRVREENVTYATITLQNYFRKYAKLGGMTGTAMTEAEEFNKIYKVDVTALPTNLEYVALRDGSDLVETEYRENGYKFACFVHAGDPEKTPVFWRRKDYPDVVYRTEEAKLRAIVTEITKRHVRGQPLLVGTASVELSERLSARLRAEPLQHLALCLILRDAYLESKGMADEGLRIDELQPLYAPLDTLGPPVFRPFGKQLEIALNPARPENLERLARALELGPEHQDRLAKVLQSGIPHEVLNAKEHDRESLIIARAGASGSVTIATNMAGRGVDIKLGGEIPEEVLALVNRVLRRAGVADPYNMTVTERLAALDRMDPESLGIYQEGVRQFREFMQGGDRVRQAGGLHVLGSQRHEARRIDNQLRGRAARQGDPGSSQFFLSLEDELMRLFGGSQVSGIMQRLNIDDAVPIAHSLVDRTIEQSQTRVEGANFDTRKHLLEYDDVLNQQREVFYGQRNRVFTKEDLTEDIEEMLSVEVDRRVRAALADKEGPWRLLAWLEETQPTLNIDAPEPYPSFMLRAILGHLAGISDGRALLEALLDVARGSLEAQRERLAHFVDEQMDRVSARVKDQVRQRVEAAETAIEGARMEAEESGAAPDARAIARSVEEVTGIRLAFDGKNGEASDLLDKIPDQIRAALEGGAWSALVQAVERRIGESLGLDQPPPSPIDWDDALAAILDSLDQLWARRVEAFFAQIRSELEPALAAEARVEESARVRALVRMSYGQRTFFDPRTHQRRTAIVARLSYPYWAARLIEDAEPKELAREILDHLHGAQEALRRSIGRAEVTRIAAVRVDEMEERLQSFLRGILGEEGFSEAAGLGTLGQLPEAARAELADGLGRRLLAEFHRRVLLSVGDRLWVEYLTEMEALRTSIGLEAYGQRDPLVQYKSRAFDLFQALLNNIRSGVVSALFRVAPASAPRPQAAAPSAPRPERAPSADEPRAPQPEAEDSEKKKRRRRRR
jgi:preprotein translocase subunit SecA